MRFHIIFLILALSGCAIFNPYETEFDCPDTFKGKCASVRTAYKESLGENGGTTEKVAYNYRKTLFERLANQIEEAEDPLIVPPKAQRILILNYTGDNNDLFGYRHVYFFTPGPTWMMATGAK